MNNKKFVEILELIKVRYGETSIMIKVFKNLKREKMSIKQLRQLYCLIDYGLFNGEKPTYMLSFFGKDKELFFKVFYLLRNNFRFSVEEEETGYFIYIWEEL